MPSYSDATCKKLSKRNIVLKKQSKTKSSLLCSTSYSFQTKKYKYKERCGIDYAFENVPSEKRNVTPERKTITF